MNIAETVNRLAEIKIKIQALQSEEKTLLSSISTNGHTPPKARKYKSSGWKRRRISEAHKKTWANYTPEERQARINKALSGRGVKPLGGKA